VDGETLRARPPTRPHWHRSGTSADTGWRSVTRVGRRAHAASVANLNREPGGERGMAEIGRPSAGPVPRARR